AIDRGQARRRVLRVGVVPGLLSRERAPARRAERPPTARVDQGLDLAEVLALLPGVEQLGLVERLLEEVRLFLERELAELAAVIGPSESAREQRRLHIVPLGVGGGTAAGNDAVGSR